MVTSLGGHAPRHGRGASRHGVSIGAWSAALASDRPLRRGVVMDAVHAVFVIAHMIGLASLLVGSIGALVRPKSVFATILLWGARIQVLTGIILAVFAIVGADEDESPNYVKLAVKLLVALGVAGLAETGTRRSARPLIAAALVLTVINAAIASTWH